MPASQQHFDEFKGHTLLKHAIFRYYVERWSRILLRHFDELRIVDACAGAGQDAQGRPGSPMIAVVEARKAVEQMKREVGKPRRIEVVAIEKDPARYRLLCERMGQDTPDHRTVCGTLADVIGSLALRTPTLFFIDPFGLEPLRADVIRQALAGARNEVFLLFADQAALRHIGAVDSLAPSDHPVLDLFGSEPPPAEPAPSQAVTGARAEEIMTAAFDRLDWKATVARNPSKKRHALVLLYCDMLRSFGAQKVLVIPMISGSIIKYHLIYATKSPRGYDVMKDSLGRALNTVLAGSEEQIRLGAQASVAQIERTVLDRFAGREIFWVADGAGEEGLRRYVAEETPAMPWQMDELKERLKRFRLPGRKARYAFPPA
ncbi:MAG TPA: three-Cys-motif partner protein TcmP [Longimicrobium sp.]|nr:three-Cys-motif partner protein TcmP [Longimicrobium sp.]